MITKIMNSNNAPIVIFAFNRAKLLADLVDSLKKCRESAESDLYIFVDGPRSSTEETLVQEVRNVAKGVTGFRSVTYHFSEANKGLGTSIISGVSEVMKKYGRAIVLEDDLLLTPNYLSYMNQALEYYADKKDVFSICGCSLQVEPPKDYIYDVYFETRNNSTGWATWIDRWESVDWELKDWSVCEKNSRDFCKWAGSDCFLMLKNWKLGKNKSWAIRFCYAQFFQKRLSVFPILSKVDNQGFDGSGTNSKRYNRFKYEIDKTYYNQFRFASDVQLNDKIHRQIMRYHSIPLRIWSRLMYLIYR